MIKFRTSADTNLFVVSEPSSGGLSVTLAILQTLSSPLVCLFLSYTQHAAQISLVRWQLYIRVVCYTAKTIKNGNKKRVTNKIGRIGEHMTGNESQVTQNGSQRPHSIDLEFSIIFLSGK